MQRGPAKQSVYVLLVLLKTQAIMSMSHTFIDILLWNPSAL